MRYIIKRLKHLAILCFTILSLFACKKDFLDRIPGDQISDQTFFLQASDFQNYVNGLYDYIEPANMANRWSVADGSDDVVTGNTPSPSLMLQSESGLAPNASAAWNSAYAVIRSVNYLIQNADKAQGNKSAQQYIGEAYFIRAFAYFNLLKTFGDVPYIDKVLSTDSKDLYKPRESRDVVAGKIIDDLDAAISKLDLKGVGEAVAGRVNRETALVFKTRVALYEGSWEYYHDRANTPFKVEGKDGKDLLNEVVEAGDTLMAHSGSNIYVGPQGFEYEYLFNQRDYAGIPGVFFYKHFDNSLGVTFSWRNYISGQVQSPTKSAIDAYLMSDGKPQEISSVTYDKTNQSSLFRTRDPRLAQTVYSPDRGGFLDLFGGLTVEQAWNTRYPDLNNSYVPNGSGYRIIKGTPFTTISLDINETDQIVMRYAEALLNYAEAKAILGTLTQNDINKTVNVLRGRVGMVPMNMTEVNAWGINYAEANGFDPSEPVVLNEIRRERRVELMFEGFRTDDIKRWALYDKVFNGYKPVGAYFQEIFDYWNNTDTLIKAGLSQSDINGKRLVDGVNCEHSGDYVRCFWRISDFSDAGNGYYINPQRDYLSAIPKDEIELYEQKAAVTLSQNPGWF
jgi:hypothetical protein